LTEPIRVAFVSLGCAKNLVDSEKMLGQLAESGCAITADEDDAHVMVINTCGFLSASREEAVGVISDAVALKERGTLRRVVVAGCLVQRDGESLLERVPGIDALVGVNNRDDIVRAVTDAAAGATPASAKIATAAGAGIPSPAGARIPSRTGSRGIPIPRASAARRAERDSRETGDENGFSSQPSETGDENGFSSQHDSSQQDSSQQVDTYLGDYHPYINLDTARLRITPRHYAYLRISEGCNQKCTFCTIPSIRGPMHCKPPETVLAEARELVSDGAVELNLIGQDTTSYGEDIGYTPGLAGLLRELDRVDGAEWIRLMYVYPSVFTDAMIDAIAECERIVKYIDIPLQHINDRVLKAMHRRVTRAQTETLLGKLRDRIPGVSIRTTLIAGFPGETDAEFAELVSFVREFGFDALGVFAYSQEPETPAGRMKHQLPESLKRERVDALMLAQQEVAFARAESFVGRTFEVLIDGPHAKAEVGNGRGAAARQPARHAGQAPEVDSLTYLRGAKQRSGSFCTVRCTARSGYDLIAVPTRHALTVVA